MHKLNLTNILISILIIIFILVAVTVFFNDRWSDGDEVHYLVVTSSLLQDGDLQLDNNYANKDYFTHHSNEEKPHDSEGREGESRTFHGILTSVLMVPGYGLSLLAQKILGFDSNGAFLFFPRMTILFLHIIFSLVLIVYIRTIGFSKNISILTVILFLIQLPIIIYSQAIYPDLLSGYFVMTGILGILLFANCKKYKFLIISGIFFGLCIFLHSKLIILTAGLIFCSFWYLRLVIDKIEFLKIKSWFDFRSRDFWKMICSLLGPWLGFLLANIIMKFYWFGAFYLDAVGNITGEKFLPFLINPFQGWLGQWLDIEMGLLWSAPVIVLIFPGLVIWFRKQKSIFLLIVPITLAYLLLTSAYNWHGGFSPVGRYTLIAIPLLLPALSWVLQASKKIIWLRWIVGILTFLSFILSCLIFFVGRRGLPYNDGYNIYWRTLLKFLKLDFIEPIISLNFFEPGLLEYAVGAGVFILLFGLGYYISRKNFEAGSND